MARLSSTFPSLILSEFDEKGLYKNHLFPVANDQNIEIKSLKRILGYKNPLTLTRVLYERSHNDTAESGFHIVRYRNEYTYQTCCISYFVMLLLQCPNLV